MEGSGWSIPRSYAEGSVFVVYGVLAGLTLSIKSDRYSWHFLNSVGNATGGDNMLRSGQESHRFASFIAMIRSDE